MSPPTSPAISLAFSLSQTGLPFSPAELLEGFLSPTGDGSRLVLLSGLSGAGKTSACLELVAAARLRGILPLGLVSPPVFSGAQKTGIDLLDLESGELRRLASRRTSPDCQVATADWQFDPAVIRWGNERLERYRAGGLLLILDELGPLEFGRGMGFQSGMSLLDGRSFGLAVAVIRPALLHLARARWPWAWVVEPGLRILQEGAG